MTHCVSKEKERPLFVHLSGKISPNLQVVPQQQTHTPATPVWEISSPLRLSQAIQCPLQCARIMRALWPLGSRGRPTLSPLQTWQCPLGTLQRSWERARPFRPPLPIQMLAMARWRARIILKMDLLFPKVATPAEHLLLRALTPKGIPPHWRKTPHTMCAIPLNSMCAQTSPLAPSLMLSHLAPRQRDR